MVKAGAAAGSSHRRQKGTALDVPHVDRQPHLLGPTGQHPSAVIREQLQVVSAVADRPGQCWSESALRILLQQHPCRCVELERGAEREHTRGRRDGGADVVADQRLQLERAQAAATIGVLGADHGAAVTSSWSCACRSAC